MDAVSLAVAAGLAGSAKAYADAKIAEAIAALPKGVVWRGSVNYYADLPATPEAGDCYTVKYSGSSGTSPSGQEYAWGKYDGVNQWIPIGPDMSVYRTSAAQDVIDATKQTKITASGILQGDGSGGVTEKSVDATPTASSENLVTSGGVATALGNKANLSTLSTPYSNTSTYAVGDYCIHDGSLYRCSVPITEPEEWTAAHWTEKKVVDGFSDVKGLKLAGTAQTPDADGYISIPQVSMNKPGLAAPSSTGNTPVSGWALNNRYIGTYYNPATANTCDVYVKAAMTDGLGPAWTDTEKQGAWTRQSIIKTSLDAVLVPLANYYLGEQSTLTLTLPTTGMSAGQTISVVFYSNTTATTLNIVGDFLGDTPTIGTNQRVELSFLYDGVYWMLLSNVMSVPQDEVSV